MTATLTPPARCRRKAPVRTAPDRLAVGPAALRSILYVGGTNSRSKRWARPAAGVSGAHSGVRAATGGTSPGGSGRRAARPLPPPPTGKILRRHRVAVRRRREGRRRRRRSATLRRRRRPRRLGQPRCHRWRGHVRHRVGAVRRRRRCRLGFGVRVRVPRHQRRFRLGRRLYRVKGEGGCLDRRRRHHRRAPTVPRRPPLHDTAPLPFADRTDDRCRTGSSAPSPRISTDRATVAMGWPGPSRCLTARRPTPGARGAPGRDGVRRGPPGQPGTSLSPA